MQMGGMLQGNLPINTMNLGNSLNQFNNMPVSGGIQNHLLGNMNQNN
jgi:hypothetical protein